MPASSDELFRLAFELSPSGVVVTDDTGTILLVNAETERLFGYTREELVGRSIDLLIPDRFRRQHPGYRRAFLAAPRTRPMGAGRDLFGLHKDGSEIPVEIGLSPVQTASGTLVLSSVVDISTRRTLEAQLRQAQKLEAIGTLAGGIAHDFNNVLRAIVGYSELVSAVTTDARASADLENVRRAASRGQALVQRLLAFSRPTEQTGALAHLDRAVTEALELLRASIPRTIEIRSHIDSLTPTVRIDETRVHQVVVNLVSNAANAIGDDVGVIDVFLSAEQPGEDITGVAGSLVPSQFACLKVVDNGVGMPEHAVQRAFEPFYTTRRGSGGSGLGLSVVHGIAQGAGGFVDIRSTVGAGTEVRVYLPGVESSTTTDTLGTTATPTGPHILFVEDEELLVELGQRQLEDEGYRVTAHTSSPTALDDFRARADTFELVVTDVTMPRLSGLQFAQEIRRLRPGVPILVVSGLADTMDMQMLEAIGVSEVLRKPHTGKELAAAVARLLAPSAPGPV